ncbi:MAG: type 4a pilus biogenesis protein PilO [Deltaproteobacteria bacterium]|nr:type 4a pilus biogenesis protein PilO [Deltaproteobacteria bacterium]MDQ3301282.1 type 4a pilus biogenesis protein PilO [Myxococcota bacterium]
MAASGVMADFAKMPTGRKVLVFAVIGMFLGLLYWRFVFKPLTEKVANAEQEHQQLVGLNRQLEGDIPRYAVLRQQMAELQKTIEENQKALPTEAEVPAFFETLERKMQESGVEITKWTKQAEAPVESFVKVPVDIEIVGTFIQMKRFFASLVQLKQPTVDSQGVEERERIVSIENLVLGNPSVRNREIKLSAKFTAITFRQEDNAAAKGPTPGPTPANKPLPPATSPQGAKVRVEDSMKKDEERPEKALDKAGANDRLKGGL